MRRIRRAEYAQQEVLLAKPQHDDRYHPIEVVSHDAQRRTSVVVANSQELLAHAKPVQVVAIDEAQFFDDGLVHVANQLANEGKRVILAGLDMDFQGRPFGPMPQLLAVAEFVTKLHAICLRTGGMAHYSARITPETHILVTGGKERYEPLSRRAFMKHLDETANQ